jgi:hypothetical protein
MNLVHYFLHIYHLDFPLEKKFLLWNSEKILWGNKFLKVSLCRFSIFFWKYRWPCFSCDIGFWILTTWPFHSYTLAYSKPIYLISIEFQSIDNNLGTPLKNKLFPFNCRNLAICALTLIGFSLQTTRILRYKFLWLEVEKNTFHFDLYPIHK